MSTLKVDTIRDTNGVEVYTAKAWVNFDGTFGTSPFTVANGGIRASGNVSSVTDNGTGNYTVNFTTPMSDANYCVQVTGTDVTEAGVESAADMTTTTVKIRTHNSSGSTVDREVVSVTVFR
jgi:hypothetical protein